MGERKHLWATILGVLFSALVFAHPIQDYYQKHKHDKNMEARIIPPKAASLLVDDDYPEAIDILKSLSALKYMNFHGDSDKVIQYATAAIAAKGDYQSIFSEETDQRKIKVFGTKKKGMVRKLIAVVQTKSQFVLMIGKGKLSERQISFLPMLAKEI